MAYRSHSLRLNFCHQIKRSNANVGMDADALCQEGFGRAAQIVFPIPDVVAIAARTGVAPRGLRQRIKNRPHWCWYKIAPKGSGYRGFHAVCNIKCGAVMQCAWTPASTRGWKDHQRANLLAFCGLEVPEVYKRPLEETLPMV